MTQKIAIPLNGVSSVVLLDNGDRMTRRRALAQGYRIVDADAVKSAEAASVTADAIASWRVAIECLPEARERASATAALLASRNPETLTVQQARAFLRGLPVEAEFTETTEAMTTTDPRTKRLAEITNSMAAFNRNSGYAAKPAQPALNEIEPAKLKRLAEIRLSYLKMKGRTNTQEYQSLKNALDSHNMTGAPLSRLLASLGDSVAKLIPPNL